MSLLTPTSLLWTQDGFSCQWNVTFVSVIFTHPFNCFENVCIRFCEVSFDRAPFDCRGFYCSYNEIHMFLLAKSDLELGVHVWFAWNLSTVNAWLSGYLLERLVTLSWNKLYIKIPKSMNISYLWSWRNGYRRQWYRWWEQKQDYYVERRNICIIISRILVCMRKEVIPIQVKILERLILLTSKHLPLYSFRLHYSIKQNDHSGNE